ncbi:ensconsin-like isoform X12 [Adelges cooleyi]|uniref:ensconsin-like isoform X12 n=1 Tax=Adelges cooleyi TaxID=133065 RepID=UPI00217FD944|nr:ensconsin-like isoform X12 [Adelges cooleyi]
MGLERPCGHFTGSAAAVAAHDRTSQDDEAALSELRDILASSLSSENVSAADRPRRRVQQPPPQPVPPIRRRPTRRLVVTLYSPQPIATAGVTTVNSDNRPSTAPTAPQNSSKGGLHWFAHGAESFDPYDDTDETGKENAIKDREERLRLVREKHDEERQRKLDELKQQALAVQRYREQKEEERRRRLEEMRTRDFERRQQVEERKRQLFEAEREKREAILKKNQEREARIESKRRNERSSIVFAFGSSTPRMLEPSETGGSYWASRRATSTSNVMMLSSMAPMGPLTRRSSERELNDCSGKKRAASAGGLSNRSSDGSKSGEMTPNNRPQSSMSQSITGPSSQQPRSRPVATPRKPRPISIAVTGVTSLDQSVKSPASGERPPLPKVNVTKKAITPKVETKKFPSDKSVAKDKNKITTKTVESSELNESGNITKDEDSRSSSVQESTNEAAECDMTASMLATKQKITTEVEAKAALAERRRLAREQAEREAELERQRLEAERIAEEERIKLEEEEQRRQEEEQLRLLEEARKAEELRLQLAIEETKKREEEEKKKKEEEVKLKLEKEEAERKAKEEAEKLRQEMEIKLKKEEEDRQLRRKRVEAIMLRTRNQGKGSANTTTKEETESAELSAGEKIDKTSPEVDTPSQSQISSDAFISAEINHSSTQSNGVEPTPKQNGHSNDSNILHTNGNGLSNSNDQANGKVFATEPISNVTSNLLDLSLEPIPSNTLSTQIIDIGMSKCVQDSATDFTTTYQESKRPEQQIVNDLLS